MKMLPAVFETTGLRMEIFLHSHLGAQLTACYSVRALGPAIGKGVSRRIGGDSGRKFRGTGDQGC